MSGDPREMILTQTETKLFPLLLVFILSCIIIRKYVKCKNQKSSDWDPTWPDKWKGRSMNYILYGVLGTGVITVFLLMTRFGDLLHILGWD